MAVEELNLDNFICGHIPLPEGENVDFINEAGETREPYRISCGDKEKTMRIDYRLHYTTDGDLKEVFRYIVGRQGMSVTSIGSTVKISKEQAGREIYSSNPDQSKAGSAFLPPRSHFGLE